MAKNNFGMQNECDYPEDGDWSGYIGSVVFDIQSDLIGRIKAYNKEWDKISLVAIDGKGSVHFIEESPSVLFLNEEAKWICQGNDLDWLAHA